MEVLFGIAFFIVIITLCALAFVYFTFRELPVFLDETSSVVVIKLIEAIREVCPVGSNKGWTLLLNHFGARCWSQILPFDILGIYPIIYGSSVVVHSSATSVLNIVADLATWKEWYPSISEEKKMRAETIPDLRLQSDEYMQCDRLVIDKSSSSQVQMYRFAHVEKNGVGWILFWQVQRLDWCFFLAQPVENIWDDHPTQCLLTGIQSFNYRIQKKNNIPKELVHKLLSIKDTVKEFHLKAYPFQSLSSSNESQGDPSEYIHINDQAHKYLSSISCKLLQKRIPRSPIRSLHHKETDVLTLVPFGTARPVTVYNHKGFVLFRQPKSESFPSSHHSTPRHRPRIKNELRSRSGSFSLKRSSKGHIIKQRALSADARMPNSPISKDFPNSESIYSTPIESLLENSNVTSGNASNSTLSKLGKQQSENESKCNLVPQLKVYSSDTDSSSNDETTKSKIPQEMESLSDFELLLPHCNSEDEMIDFKTKGNLCVSNLLVEVIKASVIEIHSPPEVQKSASGGWVFERQYKDVTVFNKECPVGNLFAISYLSKAIIPMSPNLVWSALRSPLSRYMYDETIKKITVLQDFPNGQKILHTFHESTTLLKKDTQDFCLLHTERMEDSKLIVAVQSVEYEKCPLMEDVIRGMLLPSGWIVESYENDENCCVVSYLIQILSNSPDNLVLTEIVNTHPQCIINLSNYLSTKPQ
ncbi:uncharacterized protein LOC111618697 [Centruroides sculpturatus]|uniref:uncharacterized protein LOC111618697 n=1 Tax=Centruroides sculpturatus TaxID=218467 RepID=UPI000C6D3430|nr:uncharacterized protein LOC111618697 [Centruroides sculpturatus]